MNQALLEMDTDVSIYALCEPPVRLGESNNAKLTVESVLEIRRLHKEGVSGVELAQRFGITPTNVSYIIRRLAWKHV